MANNSSARELGQVSGPLLGRSPQDPSGRPGVSLTTAPFRSRESPEASAAFAPGRDHLAAVHRTPRANSEWFKAKLLFIKYISSEKR